MIAKSLYMLVWVYVYFTVEAFLRSSLLMAAEKVFILGIIIRQKSFQIPINKVILYVIVMIY